MILYIARRLLAFSRVLTLLFSILATGNANAAVTLQSAWSANTTPSNAIEEAIEALKRKKVIEPKLIVIYFTGQYDPAQVAQKLQLAFPKSHIFGQTVYVGVFTDEGLHMGKNGSIAMLSFEGLELSVGVAGAEIDPATNVQDLAVTLSKEANAQATSSKLGDESPVIMMAAKKGSEEAFIAGISVVFDRGTPSVVAEKAIAAGSITPDDLAGGLQIYCAGASTVIGLREGGTAPKMVEEIRKAMRGHPFIGGFTSAEQGQIPGTGYFNSNLMSSMAVFAK